MGPPQAARLVGSCSNRMLVVFLLTALALEAEAQFRPGSTFAKVNSCPIASAKKNFDLNKFSGDWYVLEYDYPKEMQLRDLSCVGLHFSLTGFGDILSNFTFRFPAKTGHFYHVPTFSTVRDPEPSVWETQFRGVELISIIVDTNYDDWAVLVQCSEKPGASSSPGSSSSSSAAAFLSTRILSRARNLGAGEWILVQSAIEQANAAAPYKYPIDHDVCQEIDEIAV